MISSELRPLDIVTPYVGVWIETLELAQQADGLEVTPYVGVWIETSILAMKGSSRRSHPTWVCGLKH